MALPAGKLGEGATAVTGAELSERLFQSTPPVRGGDHGGPLGLVAVLQFQSTPPARGATIRAYTHRINGVFQSTPPARGATVITTVLLFSASISIHAPREGGDAWVSPPRNASFNFNPRPPRGGRPRFPWRSYRGHKFQSTPPARGATSGCWLVCTLPVYFNPRPPRGGRQQRCTVLPANL